MNEPIRPNPAADQTQDRETNSPPLSPSPFVRILLLVLTAVAGTISGICPDLITASVFAAAAAGLFSYCFLLTFSPLVFTTPIAAALAAFLASGNLYHGLQALLFLPLGVSVCLSMLRMKNKTTAVLRGAAAIGTAILVLFCIGFVMTHGTLSPQALKDSYNGFFDDMRTQMTDSMIDAYQAMEQASKDVPDDLAHPVIDAPVTEAAADSITGEVPATDAAKQDAAIAAYIRSMVELSVNSVKLAVPSLFAVAVQIIAYLALGVYQLVLRLTRTPYMLPANYRITVSRTAAVIFISAYLINLFSAGSDMSVLQIASANLSTMLIPGIFLMGLRSLARRAKDPVRRRSFIITAVVIAFLVFVFPSYAIFFIIIDGVGEIFFGGRSIF